MIKLHRGGTQRLLRQVPPTSSECRTLQVSRARKCQSFVYWVFLQDIDVILTSARCEKTLTSKSKTEPSFPVRPSCWNIYLRKFIVEFLFLIFPKRTMESLNFTQWMCEHQNFLTFFVPILVWYWDYSCSVNKTSNSVTVLSSLTQLVDSF